MALEDVLLTEQTLTREYHVPLKLVQDLYLSGINLWMVGPIIKWATETRDILREKGITHNDPTLQQLLKVPFNHKLRKELELPTMLSLRYDIDIEGAIRTLGQLMETESS
jgi:hypothetical protein